MAVIDPEHYAPFSTFFPELTHLQSKQVCLLAFNHLTVEELAEFRGVSVNTVRESMSAAQKKLRVNSIKDLKIVVTLRVLEKLGLAISQKYNS